MGGLLFCVAVVGFGQELLPLCGSVAAYRGSSMLS